MHIKQITISNFRSFRQQGEIQAFSAGTNTVVGRNGSGKSNLFDAVQFCLLAPRFAHLRQEERQALLHEGSGSAAVNAFVEIVFDNSDHRFQHENSDEVVLRRTIGLKKDEFFLQRKRTAKNEIQSLLEGAGFSKSNPYFIVQQGKVQDLCIMSDVARLRLLKEVAGTTVYDEKKAESVAKMEENNNSIDKITDMLENIEERLEELSTEKDELNAYQQLDRARRSAEYGLYSAELQKARTQLDQIEHDRVAHVEMVAGLHEASKVTHDAIRNNEALQKTRKNGLRRIRKVVQGIEEDKNQAVKGLTKLELECKELRESIVASQEQAVSNRQLLEQLSKEIDLAEKKLSQEIEPAYCSACDELQEMTDQRESSVKEMQSLYAKQGRGKRYSTVEERDTFLKQQSKELSAAKADKEGELSVGIESLASLRRNIVNDTSAIKTNQAELSKLAETQQSLDKAIDAKGRQRVQLMDARRENWRNTEQLQESVRETREILHNCLSDTKKVMPRATAMGIEALKGIVEQEGLEHGREYFGMLMENLKLKDEKYQTAVEVAAQNSLFHVIVDTDLTAAKLMKQLEAKRLGRVTFLPLNQLRIESVKYPDSNDVRPMLDLCIDYEKRVEKAFQHVFAKKLIARSSEIASEWSSKLSMDAITLEGDLCSRKGALTGGFVDSNKSRLLAYAKQIEAQSTLRAVERDYQAMNRKSQEFDHGITSLMQELQRLGAKKAELNHKIKAQELELGLSETRLETHKKQIDSLEKTSIPPLERAIKIFEADIECLQKEIGTELQQTLSQEDRERLAELKKTQDTLQQQIEAQREKVESAEIAKQKLHSLLENNLFKRRLELTQGGEDGSNRRRSRMTSAAIQVELEDELLERERECENATLVKEDLETRLVSTRRQEEELSKEVHAAKNEHEKLRGQDLKNRTAWEDGQQKSERFLTKRAMYTSKRENNMRKIQELGSLPPPAELKKYANKSASQLEKVLDNINTKLTKYSHVNKKAFDQYVNFSDTRERLLKRKDELDHGAQKVQELIQSLDQKKDEAINRTFRGVSSHFKDVFKELVPNGAGELILHTTLDEESVDSDRDPDSDEALANTRKRKKKYDNSNPDVSLYRSIGIKVRFSEVGENFMMSQLSGGQKALVALGLIFAIQRCDPAPFYLFDELDQALDSTYRAAVANVIQKQAGSKESPTQFIVSTFRQELVAVASRCYGISHQNKVSSIHHMPKKDAQLFIANLMSEEEAVGEVTSLAQSKVSRLSLGSRKRKTIEKMPQSNANDTEDDASHTSGNVASVGA